jgi:hypothetical protein
MRFTNLLAVVIGVVHIVALTINVMAHRWVVVLWIVIASVWFVTATIWRLTYEAAVRSSRSRS